MPVLTSGQQERKSKQRKIRNSEYYDMEGTFDRLYAESKKDKTFNHLMEIIESEENIKLAYRTIKKNTGSDTSGVDKRTIADLAKLSEEEYVRLIRKQFSNYHPRPVRRVEIPKPTAHGMSGLAAFTRRTMAPISVVIWLRTPVTPREDTQYTLSLIHI